MGTAGGLIKGGRFNRILEMVAMKSVQKDFLW